MEQDLFEDGKPIVIGLYARQFIADYINASSQMLGGLFPSAHFMTFFPVVVRREHFILFRSYIETLHNSSFDQVFGTITNNNPFYCQFDLMFLFLWRIFIHDSYS